MNQETIKAAQIIDAAQEAADKLTKAREGDRKAKEAGEKFQTAVQTYYDDLTKRRAGIEEKIKRQEEILQDAKDDREKLVQQLAEAAVNGGDVKKIEQEMDAAADQISSAEKLLEAYRSYDESGSEELAKAVKKKHEEHLAAITEAEAAWMATLQAVKDLERVAKNLHDDSYTGSDNAARDRRFITTGGAGDASALVRVYEAQFGEINGSESEPDAWRIIPERSRLKYQTATADERW